MDDTFDHIKDMNCDFDESVRNAVKNGFDKFADQMTNNPAFQTKTLLTVVAMLCNHVQALEKRIEALEAKPQTDEKEEEH